MKITKIIPVLFLQNLFLYHFFKNLILPEKMPSEAEFPIIPVSNVLFFGVDHFYLSDFYGSRNGSLA